MKLKPGPKKGTTELLWREKAIIQVLGEIGWLERDDVKRLFCDSSVDRWKRTRQKLLERGLVRIVERGLGGRVYDLVGLPGIGDPPDRLEHHFLAAELYLSLLDAVPVELQRNSMEKFINKSWRWTTDPLETMFEIQGIEHDSPRRRTNADAVITLPAQGRRLYIEADTGEGRIKKRAYYRERFTTTVSNYISVFTPSRLLVGGKSLYLDRHKDGLLPRVFFLTKTQQRADQLTEALRKMLQGTRGSFSGLFAAGTVETARAAATASPTELGLIVLKKSEASALAQLIAFLRDAHARVTPPPPLSAEETRGLEVFRGLRAQLHP